MLTSFIPYGVTNEHLSMSVIVEFRVPSADFELGRILSVEELSMIELETLVPVGEATVPLFWIHNSTRDSFVDGIKRHPAVHDASEIDVFETRTLIRLDWDSTQDHLFESIGTNDGQLLSATGTADTWTFEVRFPSRENLSEFSARCENAKIGLQINRVYNPDLPDVDPWYGLTEAQREAMLLAMRMGYYEIPGAVRPRNWPTNSASPTRP